MPPARYKSKLQDADVLQLFRDGTYAVDLQDGTIRGRSGKVLVPHEIGRSGHLYVGIYCDERTVRLAVHRIVWMAGADSVIPPAWEVHHRDTDVTHNWFSNLFCLHPVDHRKAHGRWIIEEEEVPF